jgi:HAD superfamily hydrolase (TIGR01509 family)
MTGRRGLFLDFDGTLADSLHVMRSVYFRFLEEFGSSGSAHEFDLMNGPPLPRVITMLKERHRIPGDENTLLARYSNMIDSHYETVLPHRGASELLQAADDCGWHVAIISSNSRARIEAWTRRFGICADVIASDDVRVGKPSPEPYLLALRRGGFDPEHSIAVEDSAQGARSAIDAGLNTYILTISAREGDWPAGARPISSLTEIIPVLRGLAH